MRKFIYDFFENLRNPSLRADLTFLEKSDYWSYAELKKYQEKKFLELVHFSLDYNPYYQRVLGELNLSKNDFKSIDDLQKIPLIDKKQLMELNDELHSQYKFKKTFVASSSGSTGESLYFTRNEEADSFTRAVIKRGYSWYGVHPADYNIYFWGFNFSLKKKVKTKFQDFLQNRRRIFSYSKRELNAFSKKLGRAKYIQGYSSMIYEMAKYVKENDSPRPQNLKLIKGTSEKILAKYNLLIQEVFGLKMISEYGAAESGIIAFECPDGHMHIAMESVILEVIDKEVVVTNLHLKSFPIIRYKLGDYVKLAPEYYKCSCGRNSPIILEIEGRVGKKIMGKEGSYPSLSIYNIIKNLSKIERLDLIYQVVQNQKGVLDVFVMHFLDDKQKSKVVKEFKKYFNEDIDINIYIKETQFEFTGKKVDFVSNL